MAYRLLSLQGFSSDMINLDAPEWWEQLPVLTGSNLYLREVESGDIETLFEVLTDPQVSRYISPPPPSPAAFDGFIEWAQRQRKAGMCVCFAVVPKGLNHSAQRCRCNRLHWVRIGNSIGPEARETRLG